MQQETTVEPDDQFPYGITCHDVLLVGAIEEPAVEWQLYAKYHGRGLVDKETLLPDGSWKCPRRTRWTEEGHRFLIRMLQGLACQRQPRVKSIQLMFEFAM